MSASAVAVRERQILMSGPMVRAIPDGAKTQTRRTRGLGLVNASPNDWSYEGVIRDAVDRSTIGKHRFFNAERGESLVLACPYGQPGDRLWVRETWGYVGGDEYLYQQEPGAVGYRADATVLDAAPGGRWRPSIHMPRWASRLTLEITGVRVERVQDISDTDCEAEGVRPASEGDARDWRENESGWRRTYRQLWDSLNAARGYGWDVNPWVWCLSFRRVTP